MAETDHRSSWSVLADRVVLIAVVSALVAGLGAGYGIAQIGGSGNGEPGSAIVSIRGDVTLTSGGSIAHPGDGSCAGISGFDDLATGTTVTVHDQTGKVIAIGALGPGTYHGGQFACVFSLDVPNVP